MRNGGKFSKTPPGRIKPGAGGHHMSSWSRTCDFTGSDVRSRVKSGVPLCNGLPWGICNPPVFRLTLLIGDSIVTSAFYIQFLGIFLTVLWGKNPYDTLGQLDFVVIAEEMGESRSQTLVDSY